MQDVREEMKIGSYTYSITMQESSSEPRAPQRPWHHKPTRPGTGKSSLGGEGRAIMASVSRIHAQGEVLVGFGGFQDPWSAVVGSDSDYFRLLQIPDFS